MSEPSSATPIAEPAICAACGILVQANRPTCSGCGATHAQPWPTAHAQPKHGYWVAVQATFTCNACRFESPLNHFELGEGVVCTRCGLEQRYERSAWRELVDFAHRVGDFGSGGPQGRLPDAEQKIELPGLCSELGSRKTWAQEGQHRATAGNPLCKSCKAPLVVKRATKALLEVQCPACGESRRYERPETARRIKQLGGVLADEHEEGGREVVFNDASGVVVLSCPSCAAPLDNVKDADGVIVCGYCHAACRISSHSHARAGHKDTPTKTWWLYFDQSSPERKKRLNQARQKAERLEKQRQLEEQRARDRAARANQPSTRTPPMGAADEKTRRAIEAAAKEGARALAAKPSAVKSLLVIALVLPIGAALIYLQHAPTPSSRSKGPSGEVLKQFSFAMSPSEAGRLVGVDGSDDMNPTFDGAGVIKKARIYRGSGSGPRYDITLFGGEKLDLDAALERLRTLAPNRLRKTPNSYEINVHKSLLRFDSRVMPQYRGTVQAGTWVRDEQAVVMADAMWSLARYAVFGGPKPSAKELELVNGPKLAKLSELDLKVPIEQAAKRVMAEFPWASCQTINDLNKKETQMVCKIEVDHPLVKEVHLAWPNGAAASIEAAAFAFTEPEPKGSAAPGAIQGCLDKALGAGQDVVTDHATGKSQHSWQLDRAGDKATIESYGLSLDAPDGRDLTVTPAWVGRFAAVVTALDACRP